MRHLAHVASSSCEVFSLRCFDVPEGRSSAVSRHPGSRVWLCECSLRWMWRRFQDSQDEGVEIRHRNMHCSEALPHLVGRVFSAVFSFGKQERFQPESSSSSSPSSSSSSSPSASSSVAARTSWSSGCCFKTPYVSRSLEQKSCG